MNTIADQAAFDQGAGSMDPALACFILLAQFLGLPADPAQIVHDRGRGDQPFSFDELLRVAKRLDLIAKRRSASLEELPKLPLPAIIALNDEAAAVLLRVDDSGENGTRYLVMPAGTEKPVIWDADEAAASFALDGGNTEVR